MSSPDFFKRAKLFAESFAELCARVFAVEFRDETGADLGGTHRFALVSVGAITEPSSSIACTIFNTRRAVPGEPCGKNERCETFAAAKSIADPFGHAAAHAPQPMHAAASIARSASCLGTRIEFASGAEPARAEMNPPACTIRSSELRSTTKSLRSETRRRETVRL